MSTRLGKTAAVACILLVCTAAKAGERSYTFYELGHLGCPGFAEARDINDTGRIAGNTQSPNCQGDGHAFEWHNGVMMDLSDPSEGEIPWGAEGISEPGLVLAVGGPERVLILEDGISTQIDPPPGCEKNGSPERINAGGTMAVGQCTRDSALGIDAPAVYWTADGSGLDLEYFAEVPDDADGWANDVNDAGIVVGGISAGADGGWAFIWSDGVMIELPNLLGGTWINAWAINNAGLIAGSASTATGSGAMSYDMTSGIMTELGPGTASDVNIRGVAVGHDIIDLSFLHAMLYADGEAVDIHGFLAPNWDDSHAEAINSYGWIVGYGEDQVDDCHGWLLVPVYDKGDYDGDTDVDHQDFQHFQRCFAAEPYPNGTLHVGCSVFDFDDDVDLDLDDYAAFQSAFTGPTAPNLNPNGPG